MSLLARTLLTVGGDSFFQPDKEEFLEYEISKLVHNLAKPEKATIGVYSDLPVQSTVDQELFNQLRLGFLYNN